MMFDSDFGSPARIPRRWPWWIVSFMALYLLGLASGADGNRWAEFLGAQR